MSIPPDMQQRMLETQGELQSVRARLSTLQQSKKVLALAQAHVSEKEDVTKVWQGVGKMFLAVSKDNYADETAAQIKSYDEQVSSLEKKELYYKTTLDKMLLAVQKD